MACVVDGGQRPAVPFSSSIFGGVRLMTKHRMCETPEYASWENMYSRCGNPNSHAFEYWGGRGIKVCARWSGPDGFTNFIADMGRKPLPELTLDRIDNHCGYCKENCRWATRKQQVENRRWAIPSYKIRIAVALRKIGRTYKYIGRSLGVSPGSAYHYARRLRVPKKGIHS
jgi:hypothetical protein